MAIVSRDSAGTNNNLSVLTDHLGSVVRILDHSGNPAISESFAAYGERRDPVDWQGPITNEAAVAALTQRGFTGQTHLDASRLIHFGGRVLDAQFGRFLSADPNVPDPGSTQSFNRYSYLENDPLSGTDPSGFFGIDLGGFADNFNVSVSWRFGRRYSYQAPQNGCIVANAIGCYATAPVKALLDVIVDKVIGPLPSYQRADDLVLYITQPDCPIWSNCGSEDGEDDDEGGWGWKDVLGTIVDFTPIIGDAKGIWEAIKDPTPVNIIAAGVGLAGPWGDAAAKGLKAAAKARRALGADVANRIPDSALVCRGGACTADRFSGGHGVSIDANGNLQNVSVNSAAGKSVEDLTEGIKNKQVGVTTVGEVRAAGGDVIPSPTAANPFHCTLCGITPQKAEELFTPTINNPNSL